MDANRDRHPHGGVASAGYRWYETRRIDVAFPFNGATGIDKVQFLVQTEAHF